MTSSVRALPSSCLDRVTNNPTWKLNLWLPISFVSARHRRAFPTCPVLPSVQRRLSQFDPFLMQILLQWLDLNIPHRHATHEGALKMSKSFQVKINANKNFNSPVNKSSRVLLGKELRTFDNSAQLSMSKLPITSFDMSSFSLSPPTPVSSELS